MVKVEGRGGIGAREKARADPWRNRKKASREGGKKMEKEKNNFKKRAEQQLHT